MNQAVQSKLSAESDDDVRVLARAMFMSRKDRGDTEFKDVRKEYIIAARRLINHLGKKGVHLTKSS